MVYKKVKFHTILIVFVLLIAITFFAFIFFRKGQYVEVVVKVGEPNYVYQVWRANPDNGDVYSWFSQLLKPGMIERDGLGSEVAIVEKVFRYDSSPNTANTYLTLKIKTVYSRGSGQYTFKGKPVLVGSEIELYLNQVLVNGTITDILNTSFSPSYHKVTVEALLFPQILPWIDTFQNTNGVPNYLADSLRVGETISDSQGKVVVKVIDEKVSDAKTLIPTSDGRLVTQFNPLLKDVTYTLEVTAVKVDDKYFLFGNLPIVVGQILPIHTKTASLYPTVTRIISVQ